MSSCCLLLIVSILASAIAGNGSVAFTFSFSHSSRRNPSSTAMRMSSNRRDFLNNFGVLASGALVAGFSGNANALDFDAFEKGEVRIISLSYNKLLAGTKRDGTFVI